MIPVPDYRQRLLEQGRLPTLPEVYPRLQQVLSRDDFPMQTICMLTRASANLRTLAKDEPAEAITTEVEPELGGAMRQLFPHLID